MPAPYEDNNERMKHPGSVVYLGSTMKPLTVLIGLQEKLFSPGETYSDYGYAEIGRAGSVRRIWNSGNASFGPHQGIEGPASVVELIHDRHDRQAAL